MPNKIWDRIPVYAWYYNALQEPETNARVLFRIIGAPNGVKRVDGRAIYRAGASMDVTVGPDGHDVTARNIVRQAMRDAAQAAQAAEGGAFDGTAWDTAWDAALPAMLCLSFPATDDPDITPTGWQVEVDEKVDNGPAYPVDLPLALLDQTIPGLNLASIELPPGTPSAPLPVYAKGQPGGIAALDADGDVVDADGVKVTGGGAAELTSYEDQVANLPDYPDTFPADAHTHTLNETSDTASRVAMTPAERTKLSGVATDATANATNAALRDRGTHTGTQPATSLSDLTEAVQDIVGALIVAGTNTSVTYNDAAGTFTINASTGGSTDPEVVRDTIGGALVAGAGIQITINDAGDTITVASTAVLPTRTITAGTGLSGGGDLSANRTLAVNYGTTAGTAAQGNDSRIVNAIQPDDFTDALNGKADLQDGYVERTQLPGIVIEGILDPGDTPPYEGVWLYRDEALAVAEFIHVGSYSSTADVTSGTITLTEAAQPGDLLLVSLHGGGNTATLSATSGGVTTFVAGTQGNTSGSSPHMCARMVVGEVTTAASGVTAARSTSGGLVAHAFIVRGAAAAWVVDQALADPGGTVDPLTFTSLAAPNESYAVRAITTQDNQTVGTGGVTGGFTLAANAVSTGGSSARRGFVIFQRVETAANVTGQVDMTAGTRYMAVGGVLA